MQANEEFFRIKEELHVLGGIGMSENVFSIYGRSVFSFASVYDIVDARNGMKIGAMGRRWAESMVRDEWNMLDSMDRPVGTLIEDSIGMALLRRMGTNLVPQNYDLLVNGQKMVDLKQNFNPFTYHLNLLFTASPQQFDRRVGIAAGILLAAVEGRQRSGVENIWGSRL